MKKALLLIFYLSFMFHVLLAQKNMYVGSSNGINLREGPGTDYKTTESIPNGSKVKVLSTDDEWSKVQYDGKTGYVSSQFLSENKPESIKSSEKPRSGSDSKSNSNSSKPNRSSSSSSSTNELNWGIGLRLGDPLGLTVKKYIAGGKALEFSVGTSGYNGFDYRDDFYDTDQYRDFDYLDYKRGSSVSFQAHYLFQKDFPNAKGLQWYWGIGPQIRFKSYEYYYRFRNYYGPNADDYVWDYNRDKVTNVDFGADAIIGLEYHIPNAPLSVFGDANILLELFDDPFRFFGQGGIGIRYNIK